MPPQKKTHVLASRCAGVTVPELEQSEAAVLSTLASAHSPPELQARHREVHRLVLLRASTSLQSVRRVAISRFP
jgi:hypothetical protein